MAKPFLPVLPVLSAVLLLAQGASALVYLDPANGDDANGGLSEAAPVKTFERARELAQGGDVSLMGRISVTADTAFDLDGGVLRRYISTDGPVTNLADLIYSNTQGITLTFSHIVVEGIGTETRIAGHLVAAAKADVVLGPGAVLRNSFTSTVGAGVSCANLTMTGDATITHCRVSTPSSNMGGAGATVTGLLRMSDQAAICFNSNRCEYGSSVASQRVAGGAYAGRLEMEGNASIHGNRSEAAGYLYGISFGGAGVHVRGSGVSVMRDNACIHDNLGVKNRGGAICIAEGTLVMQDSSSLVSNSVTPPNQNQVSGQAIYGGTLIMSNRACVAWNGLRTNATRYDAGDGCVNVGCLLMHDDTCIVSNKARTIGGAVVRGGGGMFNRARIAFNESTYFSSYSMSGGLLVSGGEFTMNDDAVIEGNDSATSVYGGVCVQNTGRFVLNGGAIRNNRGGILLSPCVNGGSVEIADGFVTNNTFYGVRNGSFPYYAGRHYFGGVCRLSGGVVGYNGGYGFSDVASSPATNYYCGGLVVGNADGGARFMDVGGAHYLAGTPRFEDAVKFTKPDQRFIVDGRLRTGAKVPIILKALNSKNNEIEALTAANDYGLDMDQDGTRRPRIVAVPDGENVTDAGRWAKYFSLANTLPEGVIRYCNAVGTSVGLSDRRPSEGVVIMLR